MSQTSSPPAGQTETTRGTPASSATPTTTTTSNGAGTKRKRLPACDCCKMRRLKKKAAPRSGKRIEEAKATFGAADPDAPDFMGASNTPWLPLPNPSHLSNGMVAPSMSPTDSEQRMIGRELDAALVAHLLDLYQALPQSWLPIGTRGQLQQQFEAAGRRLDALNPQTEAAKVLARVTVALTARLSSHSALFSPGGPIPPYDSLTTSYLDTYPDLREFGQRREQICEQLRRDAVELAWARGTLVHTCEDSMASCYLLEMLEGRNDPVAGKPYGSAFVSHLQTILNGQDRPDAQMKVVNMSLGWSALIMREALFAANAGRTSHFTATDDLLLCGEVPRSIEDSLLDSVDDVDVRDSVRLFFAPMRPYTYHCARLARECGEKISGTAARRQPCSEQFITKYLTQLDHLLHLFALLEARIAFVLSPAATSAHSLPAPFETERQFIMRACLHTLGLAWSSLSLPVYLELKRRISELRNPPHLNSADQQPHLQADRQRTLERLDLLFRQVGQTTLKAARLVAQCVHEAPSLAFLTQLQSENLDKWVEILRSARTVEEGGEGITRAERESDLRWILAGLKTMGWSWTDGAPVIKTIEYALQDLSRRNSTQFGPNSPSTFAMGGSGSFTPNPSSSYHHEPAFLAQSHAMRNSGHPFPPSSSASSAAPPPAPIPSFAAAATGGTNTAVPLHQSPFGQLQSGQTAAELASIFSALTGASAPSTSAAPPPPHMQSAPPTSSSQPTQAQAQAQPHFHAPPHAPPHSQQPAQNPPPPPPNALPDLSTLVSLYQTGAHDPVLSSLGGTDVSILASQYFGGTLDFPSLVGATPSSFNASLPPRPPSVPPPSAHMDGNGSANGNGNGNNVLAGTTSEFDLAKFLADPPFGFSPDEVKTSVTSPAQ
ncbi:hypothetical protein C6P46_001378 [Rhodotorula mucilaginosa]|uniref:Uncharacterized protein n=1 Tax=Rhodotorula mucilaginosa TaxID=5537 RepID=A0A9P7B2F8_RHOMI|nr:hypothetical protein C6P46_001378 [Rhodotorula mucilaginosa]